MVDEKWVPIAGLAGNEVSTMGRVRGISGKILGPSLATTVGYVRITLGLTGHRKNYLVHRLVAEAFLQNPEEKSFVNHINGSPSDNRVENLEWVTAKENNERKVNPSKQKGRPRIVVHRSTDGRILQSWGSANEAAESLGVSASAVTMCCRGKNATCAGRALAYQDQIDLPEEEWCEVEYAGMMLKASSYGRVETKSGIKTYGNEVSGYFLIRPNKKTVAVHRLVATAFCARPDGCDVVNHKDGNPKNNGKDNLEWCTVSENAKHAVRTGLTTNARAVRQFFPDGSSKDYMSTNDAAKQTGIDRRGIGRASAGKLMQSGGFRWESVKLPSATSFLIPDDDPIWAELGI